MAKKAAPKTAKKTPAKKAPAKKPAAKKPAVKKAAAKKPAAKKVVAKKPAAKAAAKKTVKKAAATAKAKPAARSTVKAAAAKRPAAKKTTSRKPAAAPKAAKGAAKTSKTASSSTAANKTAPKKATAKKAPAKKPAKRSNAKASSVLETKPNAESAERRFASATSFSFDFGKDKIDSVSGGAAPEEVAEPMADAPAKKRRGNQAGLTSRKVSHFRELLLRKRREVMGDVSSMEQEALGNEGENIAHLTDMADAGTDQYEQEFTLDLMERDRELVHEINHALAKIEDGTYGVCEGTGQPIAEPRLEAQPWARFGIEHARRMEKGRPAILNNG